MQYLRKSNQEMQNFLRIFSGDCETFGVPLTKKKQNKKKKKKKKKKKRLIMDTKLGKQINYIIYIFALKL